MNKNYSKILSLIKSIRKILISDTVNTGSDVREIYHYVSNRIVQSDQATQLSMPQITLQGDEREHQQLLPSGEYYVNIRVWVEMDSDQPNDTLERISSRIIYLLHNKQNQLNTQYPLENLRCRLITKTGSIKTADNFRKLISRTITFRVVADHEILVC